MSWLSKQSGLLNSYEIGNNFLTNEGNTFPPINTPLVSGTQYIVASVPVPDGLYGVQVTFDLFGDATTHFNSIYISVGLGSVSSLTSDNNILIDATLPNTDTYSFTYSSFVNINLGNISLGNISPIVAAIIPTFSGTAPASNSYYIQTFKFA